MKKHSKITYFYRNPKAGYSIEKVFRSFNYLVDDVEEIVMPGFNLPRHLISNLLYTFRKRNKFGINHITGDIHYCGIVLPARNTIITIHDLGLFHDIPQHGWLERVFIYNLFYVMPFRHVKFFTCISQSTKKDLIENFPWMRNKNIKVIPNPISPSFQYVPKSFSDCPIILQIGSTKNKNRNRIIQALDGIECHLRIIGSVSEDEINLMKSLNIDYSVASHLTDQEIQEEYIKCDIVALPSYHEGFGVPILEGFATGRIVITSNIDPMKEIAEDAAVLVNPYDVQSIRKGFIDVINMEDKNRLIKKGLEVVKKYSPNRIAESYKTFYNEILNSNI